ncbi:DNA helicase rad5 [Podochytrium sp. JEL0797]|nr:DNA helicase rad5 [Podochytrium sp. JEL0797]
MPLRPLVKNWDSPDNCIDIEVLEDALIHLVQLDGDCPVTPQPNQPHQQHLPPPPRPSSFCEYWLSVDAKDAITLSIEDPANPAPRDPTKPFAFASLNKLYAANDYSALRIKVFRSSSELETNALKANINKLVVPNTSLIPPCPQPTAPFKLSLYEYQLRTLSWMQSIEDGANEYYYSPGVSREAPEEVVKDKPGVGKTITSLALCQTRPFAEPDFLGSVSTSGLFKSKATVFFVPNDICSQWMQEIKKCFGDNVKTIEIKGKRQYEKATLKQVLECDILIVSYHFFVNANCIASKSESPERHVTTPSSPPAPREETLSFSWIHFHRVVFDEFHEISDKTNQTRSQLLQISGDTFWRLTGTPKLEEAAVVANFAKYLKIDLFKLEPTRKYERGRMEQFYAKEFIHHRMRCNEPEIDYPPPVYETIRVTQTAMELTLYRSCLGTKENLENLVKLCNHYQIAHNLASLAAGDNAGGALTIEQVTQRVQTGRVEKIHKLTRSIAEIVVVVERRREKFSELTPGTEVHKIAETSLKRAIALENEMREDLRSTQSQHQFFENFLTSYSTGKEKMFCGVCWEDEIPRDQLGLVPCGHVFCWECAEGVAKRNRKCPQCNMPLRVDQLMKIQPPVEELAVPEPEAAEDVVEGGMLDPNKFGSKIRDLVHFLQREMDSDPSHRFLVFIQWADLADLVNAALNTFGIATARLKSGFAHREAALRQFRAGLETVGGGGGSGLVDDQPNAALQKEDADDGDDGDSEDDEYVESEAEVPDGDNDKKGKRKAGASKVAKPVKRARKVKPVRVLMLSAKDSVSGLNLTEASHCIILHPFHDKKEDYAIGAEKQGIARALRNGQTKTVKIVRFVVEETIEQEMHERRVGKLQL